jgi:hypothetical protein
MLFWGGHNAGRTERRRALRRPEVPRERQFEERKETEAMSSGDFGVV